MARRRRHTPDQIIRKLAEGNKLLAGGAELDEVCRHLEVAESTWHRWVAQYGGMKANDAKRLRELEVENTRLKRLLAEAELDKARRARLASCRHAAGLRPTMLATSSKGYWKTSWSTNEVRSAGLKRSRTACIARSRCRPG